MNPEHDIRTKALASYSLTQPQRRKRILQDEYKTFRNRNQTNTAARSLLVNDVPHSFWGETFSYKLNTYLICIILFFQFKLVQSQWYLLLIVCILLNHLQNLQSPTWQDRPEQPVWIWIFVQLQFPWDLLCNFQCLFCPGNGAVLEAIWLLYQFLKL